MKRFIMSAALAAGLIPGIAAADEATSPFSITGSVGLRSQQFSTFDYGSLRVGFPGTSYPEVAPYFDERGRKLGYNFSAGADYNFGESTGIFDIDTISFLYTYQRADRRSTATESSAADAFYVPYIDAITRTTLVGDQNVGLFTDTNSLLDRSIKSHEFNIAVSSQTSGFGAEDTLTPHIFFAYQRLRQADNVTTVGGTDPVTHDLDAKIISDIFKFGAELDATIPICTDVSIVGGLGVSLNVSRNDYTGIHIFGGGSFNLPSEALAVADYTDTHISGEFNATTGLAFDLTQNVVFSVMGNLLWMGGVPYVMYPQAVTGSGPVSGGPAHIAYNSQFNYGVDIGLRFDF